MNSVVTVVRVSETFPSHDSEVSLRCFSSHEKAERWIEGQIGEKVNKFGLDRGSAVNGWFVMIDGWNHTLQYNLEELNVE